jgi:hypothetical protein
MREQVKHKFRIHLVLLIVIISINLPGCAMDSNEEFIQGTWLFDHTVSRLTIGHQPWYDQSYWTFKNGTYTHYAIGNHQNEESGRYEVAKSEENVIILRLLKSDFGELRIVIDKQANTLKIQGDSPYIRVHP